MDKIEKILSRWTKPKPLEKLTDVLLVLSHYHFEYEVQGSHYIAKHPLLKEYYSEFGRGGIVNIPTVRGRDVKRCYIKKLMKAISIIEEVMD